MTRRPQRQAKNKIDKNQRIFYLVLNSSGYFSTFLFGMLFWAIDADRELQFLAWVFFAIYILLGLAIRVTSDLLLLFRLSVLAGLSAFSIMIILTGGIFSSALPLLMIIPMLALFYKPKIDRYILLVVIFVVSGLILYLTNQQIWVRQGIPRPYLELFTICTFAYAALIIFTFIILFRNFITSTNKKLGLSLSELQQTTQQLIDSEKMASLGQMMAGIAHEINNPIHYIKGSGDELRKHVEVISSFEKKRNQQLLEIESESNPEVFKQKYFEIKRQLEKYKEEEGYDQDFFELLADLTETIRIGTEKTADIVSSLRMYARQKSGNDEKIDINRTIKTTVKILKFKMLDPRSVSLELDESGPFVMGNEGRLSQVMLNITSNAMDAAGEKGKVKISSLVNHYSRVEISISDNGAGIPDEIKNKIFDPFFTTKDVGEGTGLGLSISKSIIEEHEGTITFESNEEGTTFLISLPLM